MLANLILHNRGLSTLALRIHGADVKGALENIMAVKGGNKFDVMGIEKADCKQVVKKIIDVDEK